MNHPSQTYYEVFGIPQTASLDDIKQAFRRLARQYHPDVNPGDRSALETFQHINHIYQILSNPMARAEYDQSVLGIPTQQDVVHRPDRTAADWYQQGLQLSQEYRYSDAITAYSEAIALHPGLVDAYNQRGFAHYKLNHHSEAFADYARAIEEDGTEATSYYYRGLTRFQLGYTQAAITDYTEAIAIDPEHGQAHYHRGLAYEDLRNHEQAIADFKMAETLFLTKDDVARTNDAQTAHRRIANRKSPLTLLRHVLLIPSDTFMVLLQTALNPMNGLVTAFDRLTPPRAIGVSLMFVLWFVGCFVYQTRSLPSATLGNPLFFYPALIMWGLTPFLLLTISCTLGRRVFSHDVDPSGDIFVAGVALLPLSVVTLLLGQSSLSSIIITIICGGHMILTLYGGCHYIAHLKETSATVWVPIMMVFALLPLSFVN